MGGNTTQPKALPGKEISTFMDMEELGDSKFIKKIQRRSSCLMLMYQLTGWRAFLGAFLVVLYACAYVPASFFPAFN